MNVDMERVHEEDRGWFLLHKDVRKKKVDDEAFEHGKFQLHKNDSTENIDDEVLEECLHREG